MTTHRLVRKELRNPDKVRQLRLWRFKTRSKAKAKVMDRSVRPTRVDLILCRLSGRGLVVEIPCDAGYGYSREGSFTCDDVHFVGVTLRSG